MAEQIQLRTYENVSGAYTEEVGDRFGNAILKAVRLRAASDYHDTPVSEQTVYAFRGHLERTEGHIFLLTLPAEGKSVVYIVPAPDIVLPALSVEKGVLRIECDGCSVIRGECESGEEITVDRP